MDIKKALEEAKKQAGKRKFTQAVDLIITLRDFDIKREGKIEDFIRLPKNKGKKSKICAIVGPELKDQAETNADKTILAEKLGTWTKKQKVKKLAREFDFFVAQATIMPQIAQTFGKFFGPLGKMPNPKAGSVVPPTGNLAPLIEKLGNTVKIMINKSPIAQCSIGLEKMSTEDLVENAKAVIRSIEAKLPRGKSNINKIFVKTTMGKIVRVDQ